MAALENLTDIQWGEDSGGAVGTWKRVSFQRAFLSVPGVSCIGYVRAGGLPSRTVGPVTLPRVIALKIPTPGSILASKLANAEIDRITIGDPSDTIGNAFSSDCKNRLGDWGAFNWMRDGICSVAYGSGYILGSWLQWLWNLLLQPQVDKIRDRINERISSLTDAINNAFTSFQTAINTTFSNQADRINDAIGTNLDNTNSAFATFANTFTVRVNAVLEDFYAATGIPLGIIITPVHVRAINTSGFEWQSFGNNRISWIAVGRGHQALGGGRLVSGRLLGG